MILLIDNNNFDAGQVQEPTPEELDRLAKLGWWIIRFEGNLHRFQTWNTDTREWDTFFTYREVRDLQEGQRSIEL